MNISSIQQIVYSLKSSVFGHYSYRFVSFNTEKLIPIRILPLPTRHNDTQLNKIWPNAIFQNDTKLNTQDNNSQHIHTQLNDTQHNDYRHDCKKCSSECRKLVNNGECHEVKCHYNRCDGPMKIF